jgi:NADPH-dependent glutamate synthase beta subunit-like oxidoreductase
MKPMDQSELRQWEQRCIQEEPPECTAACPLHVDVRALIGHLRDGRWNDGWQTLTRVMPLAEILGRICDAPCEARCKRTAAGGAIRIGALERACVNQADGGYRIVPLPGKQKSIAILGSGLSSLTVAWDLSRKGYKLTLFEPGPEVGAGLMARFAHRLTAAMVRAELAWLEKWGVCFETGRPIHTQEFIAHTRSQFQAIYIGLDAVSSPEWALARHGDGSLRVAPMSQTTSDADIFAGGADPSVIHQVAQGRWAATTIDRCLQKVSPTAGREKEGPYATRLVTRLEEVAAQPAVAMADGPGGYNADEARAEAGRCLQCECLACVKVCPYLEAFGAYPRKYAREIYNNESIVMGTRTANRLINTCSLCGLCETVCPEDFAMQDLCLQTRQSMVAKGKMPSSAHEFALEDMAFSQSDAFLLARHAPGQERSSHLFFPGCQLCASAPGQAAALYDHLRARLGAVGLMLGCCGAPAHWAGRTEASEQILDLWQRQWQDLGRPQLLLACATCHQMFREHRPDVPIQSVWETLAAVGLPEKSPFGIVGPLAVHDPCTTREAPQIQAAARQVLAAAGVAATELRLGREKTECCGFGGLMENANPRIANEVTRRRARLSENDYLAYCAMCRDRLAAAGKRTLHLLDLIFPLSGVANPAARPRPGWSLRRENRTRLKADLLQRLWGESASPALGEDRIDLRLAPGVADLLEARRILVEDLRQTIALAERAGRKLRHATTGRLLAAFRPRHVTFWAEYGPAQAGYDLFNAYSHRMMVGAAEGAGQVETGETQPAPWGCVACDQPLTLGQVSVSYMNNTFTTEMPHCPRCGLVLVPEALALGKMAEVEQILEDK